MFAAQILHLPSSIYHTFVIEERYGFNKSTPKTFVLDLIKGWILMVVLGGLLLSGVLWFFEKAGPLAWIYVWILVTIFQLIVMYLAPIIIMPLFNTFTPLEECNLKKSIESYIHSEKFKLKGIFTMDGSKRSTKSNAFFTGFGKFRRIVLFDTLVKNHTIDELVAIVAHEMGHYKKKHIQKLVFISILSNRFHVVPVVIYFKTTEIYLRLLKWTRFRSTLVSFFSVFCILRYRWCYRF